MCLECLVCWWAKSVCYLETPQTAVNYRSLINRIGHLYQMWHSPQKSIICYFKVIFNTTAPFETSLFWNSNHLMSNWECSASIGGIPKMKPVHRLSYCSAGLPFISSFHHHIPSIGLLGFSKPNTFKVIHSTECTLYWFDSFFLYKKTRKLDQENHAYILFTAFCIPGFP